MRLPHSRSLKIDNTVSYRIPTIFYRTQVFTALPFLFGILAGRWLLFYPTVVVDASLLIIGGIFWYGRRTVSWYHGLSLVRLTHRELVSRTDSGTVDAP